MISHLFFKQTAPPVSVSATPSFPSCRSEPSRNGPPLFPQIIGRTSLFFPGDPYIPLPADFVLEAPGFALFAAPDAGVPPLFHLAGWFSLTIGCGPHCHESSCSSGCASAFGWVFPLSLSLLRKSLISLRAPDCHRAPRLRPRMPLSFSVLPRCRHACRRYFAWLRGVPPTHSRE